MKICYLANAQSIHTKRWARHFGAHGHDVTVVSFEPAEIEGTEVIVLSRRVAARRLNILLNISRVRRLVDDIRPDILHAHYVTSYGFAGALTGKHPYVATAWGTDVLIEPEKSWVYRQIVGFALRRADLVTSMAPHMTELLVTRGYAPADKVITLPFGVDTDVFNLNRRSRQHGNQPGIVVSTRRPDYGMDVDTFVRAIPAVLKAFDNVRFIMTGEGPLRQNMEQLAGELGISDHIQFRGEITHKEMPELLGTADVFVSTSPSDGNNISLNEAMACGTYPIATDIAANRAWIEPGKNGMLYAGRDVIQLAEQIIEAIKKPDWRQAVMAENWEIVRTRASWTQSMEKMTSHYERLIRENTDRRKVI
jgi:glycosyltransferase involved in cell wall biosynthesis